MSFLEDIARGTYGRHHYYLTERELQQIEDHYSVAIGSDQFSTEASKMARILLDLIAEERTRRKTATAKNQHQAKS